MTKKKDEITEAAEVVEVVEVVEVEEVEAPALPDDDQARLDNLIEIHTSLAKTRGEDQIFEFAGKSYTVFQDGKISIKDA